MGKVLDNSFGLMKKTLEVNTLAHFYTVKVFLPDMIKQNSGHIVTIASVAGHIGVCGLGDYCASKFGAIGFDESLRMELKYNNYNIKTTGICPYYMDSPMFAGVKPSILSFMIPLLKPSYVARRIVYAIRQNEEMVIIPWTLN